jgi:hypothetical protein
MQCSTLNVDVSKPATERQTEAHLSAFDSEDPDAPIPECKCQPLLRKLFRCRGERTCPWETHSA